MFQSHGDLQEPNPVTAIEKRHVRVAETWIKSWTYSAQFAPDFEEFLAALLAKRVAVEIAQIVQARRR